MSASTDRDEGTADKIAAWILYALQLLFEFLLLFSAFSVMATDPCGTGVDEPRVCEGYYFAAAFYGFWLVLLVAAITVPVLIIRARRRRWLRPVVGLVVLAVAAVVYVALVAQ